MVRAGQYLERSAVVGDLDAVGYSFGAAVALEGAQEARIGRLVLIAPPTKL